MSVVEESIRALSTTLRDIRRAPTPVELRQQVVAVFDQIEAARGRYGFLRASGMAAQSRCGSQSKRGSD